jgi:hypothetical protein
MWTKDLPLGHFEQVGDLVETLHGLAVRNEVGMLVIFDVMGIAVGPALGD